MILSGAPIKRERLHDQITRYLAVEILRGHMQEKDSGGLNEAELCRLLKVSRTALRESIRVLAAKGLVRVRPKVGIRIRPREDWNLLDPDVLAWQHVAGVDDLFVRNLCEVRLVAETAAAELAALRGTAEDLRKVRNAYDRMEANRANKAAYDAADLDFHGAIFNACHNDLLREMSSTIRAALRGTHKLTGHLSPDVGIPLHKDVADAVCDRNGRAARGAMEKLVVHATRILLEVFHPGSHDIPEAWKDLMLTRSSQGPAENTQTKKGGRRKRES